MFQINKDQAKQVYIEEGLTSDQAESLANDFPLLDDIFQEPVTIYLKDRTLLNTLIFDVKILDVMHAKNLTFLAAVKKLNTLFKPGISNEDRHRLARMMANGEFLEMP